MKKNWYWTTQVTDLMEEFVRQGFTEVTDVCYIHDQCPSICVGEYLIFLPNSSKYDSMCEKYNTYTIILDEEYGMYTGEEPLLHTRRFNDVVNFLKSHIFVNEM